MANFNKHAQITLLLITAFLCVGHGQKRQKIQIRNGEIVRMLDMNKVRAKQLSPKPLYNKKLQPYKMDSYLKALQEQHPHIQNEKGSIQNQITEWNQQFNKKPAPPVEYPASYASYENQNIKPDSYKVLVQHETHKPLKVPSPRQKFAVPKNTIITDNNWIPLNMQRVQPHTQDQYDQGSEMQAKYVNMFNFTRNSPKQTKTTDKKLSNNFKILLEKEAFESKDPSYQVFEVSKDDQELAPSEVKHYIIPQQYASYSPNYLDSTYLQDLYKAVPSQSETLNKQIYLQPTKQIVEQSIDLTSALKVQTLNELLTKKDKLINLNNLQTEILENSPFVKNARESKGYVQPAIRYGDSSGQLSYAQILKPYANVETVQSVEPAISSGILNENYDKQYATNYAFGYRVRDDHAGNDYGHEEHKSGDITKGHYHVLLPDGRVQNVDYHAGPDGYHATITYH